MGRPKGSTNQHKSDTTAKQKVSRPRTETIEGIDKKIANLEKQKADIDTLIAVLLEKRKGLEEKAKKQELINKAMEKMTPEQLAEILSKAAVVE